MAKVERATESSDQGEKQEAGRAKLPLPRSKTLSIEQLLEYWQSVPAEFSSRLSGYLYRHWPIIVRTPAYIDKLATPPESKEIILRQHGTGSYEIKLTDLDKPRGGEVCRARFKFDESFTEYEPVVEILELDQGHRENRTYIEWLRSKGKLKMPGEQTTGGTSDVAVKEMSAVLREVLADARAARQSNNKDGVESAYAKISEMFTSANKTVLEMVLGQFKQNSPADFLQLLTAFKEFAAPQGAQPLEMLKLIREFFPQQHPKQADDAFTKFIVDQLSEERKANRELMAKLLERKEESGDALSQIEKIGGVIEAVRGIAGEGGGGGRTGKWGWLQEIGTAAVQPGGALSSLLGPLATWGLAKMSGWKPGQAAPGAPPPPGQPPVQPPPPGLPGAPPQQPQPNVDPQEQFMADGLMNLFAAISMPLMKFLQEGRPGDEFADYLIEGGMLDALKLEELRQIGREKIMGMLRKQPQAWQFIQPIEQKFSQFIDEFLAWEPQQEGAEG